MPKYIVTIESNDALTTEEEFADLSVALNFIADEVGAGKIMTIRKKAIVIPAFKIEFSLEDICEVFQEHTPEWDVKSEDAHIWLVRDCLIGDRDYEWDVTTDGDLFIINFVDRNIHI